MISNERNLFSRVPFICFMRCQNLEKSEGKRMSPKLKAALASAAAAIAVICAVVVITQIISSSHPANDSTFVYRSGGKITVRIDGKEKVITDLSAGNFKCDEENNRVIYTVASSRYDGLYDLCYIEKRRSELIEPKIIDVGVEDDFSVVSGKIYYLKKNISAGANDGCVCDIKSNTIETFSGNVESIYAFGASGKVYFTKMHGSNKVLYSCENGSPEEVCRDIVNIFCYNNTEKPHIIYERKSQINTGMTELYIAYDGSEPEMICDNTYLVMFDDYTPGGNLYYFTSSDESISWTAVISDEYAESDKSVIKPLRDSFLAILGISSEYNDAFKLWQEKLIRDEIRAALNESSENGEFSAPVFTAFAYNENGTHKVAEKLDPANVYTVSDFGDPKIIYESTEIVANQTDMATLVSIAQRSTMDEVIEYARSIVAESVESKGMAYAAWSGTGFVSYELEGYDNKKTLFSFTDNGSRIFAFVRDTRGELLSLYTNSINDKLMPSAGINIDNGISSYKIVDDAVVYMKADIGKNTGDLYSYDGESTVKLSNAANAFTVEKTGEIIIIKNHDLKVPQPLADYYVSLEEGESLIGENIIVSTFTAEEDGKTAYIAATENGNALNVYADGENSVIAENVDEILLFE